MLPILPAGLAALVVAAGAGSGHGACPGAGSVPAGDTAGASGAAGTIRCLVNRERAEAGLRRLAPDPCLARAARRESADLVARQYFSHVTPDGRNLLARIAPTGYLRSAGRWLIGENLGWGAGDRATPGAMVEAWMASPPHREAMLHPGFRDVGIGVTLGSPRYRAPSGATYAMDLGRVDRSRRPRPVCRAPSAAKARRDGTPIVWDATGLVGSSEAP